MNGYQMECARFLCYKQSPTESCNPPGRRFLTRTAKAVTQVHKANTSSYHVSVNSKGFENGSLPEKDQESSRSRIEHSNLVSILSSLTAGPLMYIR